MMWLLALLLFPAVTGQRDVKSVDELRRALLDTANGALQQIRVLAPIQLPSNWSTVYINSTVAISSPWRAVLDFCDDSCVGGSARNVRPFIHVAPGGNVQFSRLFFRNFIPPISSTNLSVSSGLSPFIEAAPGSYVTYRRVVLHFRPTMVWVFGRSEFWRRMSQTGLAPVDRPFSTTQPGLYYTKQFTFGDGNASAVHDIQDCFAPFDLNNCFADALADTTLVYCPYTFKDSLNSAYVKSVRLFHSVGLDRLVYSFRTPIYVSKTVEYTPCPGSSITIDFDNVTAGVIVSGNLIFSNLALAGSKAQPRTNWPGYNPMFLSPILPVGNGVVTLRNSTVYAPNVPVVAEQLTSLPNCTSSASCRPDPAYPAIGPQGYVDNGTALFIKSWTLDKARWLQQTNSDGESDFSAWRFFDVTVAPSPSNQQCFHGAQIQGALVVSGAVVTVSNGTELRNALLAQARYIEVVSNITLDPAEWPSGDGAVQITRITEVRSCTTAHTPLFVDWNDLVDVVVVSNAAQLYFEGDILFKNLAWNTMDFTTFRLVGGVSAQSAANVDFEDTTLHCRLISALQTSNNTNFIIAAVQMNASDSATYNNITILNDQLVQLLQVHSYTPQSGVLDFINVDVMWDVVPASQGGLSTAAIIAISVVVPCVVMFSVLVALYFARWRRPQGKPAEAPAKKLEVRPVVVNDASSSGTSYIASMAAAGPGCHSTDKSLSAGESASKYNSGPSSDIEAACRNFVSGKPVQTDKEGALMLDSVLGEGSYGKVFKGSWKGTVVAVKIMVLPSYLSGKEKREKMAVMETAISSSLSHPNIVQTYTYAVEPIHGNSRTEKQPQMGQSISLHDSTLSLDGPDTDVMSWEVRLVQEFCDVGTVRDLLNRRAFIRDDGTREMSAVLETALDIARAMAHLHAQHIVHSDLKARNVLLKSGGGSDLRGFVAKVADFGLSLRIDPNATHISNAYQGTMTHMAPETLMHGHISCASDVYSFGILLWELYSGEHAYRGMPKVLLGHSVTKQGVRPMFDDTCPFEYVLLANRCWEADPSIRPVFDQILEELKRMRRKYANKPQASKVCTRAGPAEQGWMLPCDEELQHSLPLTDSESGTASVTVVPADADVAIGLDAVQPSAMWPVVEGSGSFSRDRI